MKQFYVYLHCKPESAGGDPFYVGKGIRRRAYDFLNGRNKHHKNITAKYGKENILILVFNQDSEQDAFDVEISWIKTLREAGYILANKSSGGEHGSTGCTLSEETRKKISAIHKGKKRSAKTKAKMSASHKGIVFTIEHRANISSTKKGNKNSAGCTRSEETRAKISAAQIGNKNALGTKMSEENRLKLSARMTGANLGKYPSEETRVKLSAAKKGKKLSHKTRVKISAAMMGNKNAGKLYNKENQKK